MNRYYDEHARHPGDRDLDRDRDRDRDRGEWRSEAWRGGERPQRESFHAGNHGFQEGEDSGRTPAGPDRQPHSQNPYGYYPGQDRQGREWRERGSWPQRYGQREPYNTRGYGGSRYSESQYGTRRGGPDEYGGSFGRGGHGAGYESSSGGWRQPGSGRGNYGYGAGVDSRFGDPGAFGEGPFADTSESPGYFGSGNYGDGGASFTGGFDQRSRTRYPGSLGEDTFNSGGRAGARYRTGPKGYTRSDERLREDLSERLMMADNIDSSEVTITVKDAKVTLEGTVPTRYMKHFIEDLVDAAPGVQDIDNRIRVERFSSESAGGSGQRGSSASQGGTGSSANQGAPGSSGMSTGGRSTKQ
jgi:hypothetical protein